MKSVKDKIVKAILKNAWHDTKKNAYIYLMLRIETNIGDTIPRVRTDFITNHLRGIK